MNRFRVACALALVAASYGGVAAESTLQLALVDDNQLQRIELDVECFGESYAQLWDKKFAAIFAYCDLDGDGRLSAAEAERLPSARALREATCSGFAPVIGQAPKLAELDHDASGDVTQEELQAYYRKQEVAAPLFGVGAALFTGELNKSLRGHLDRNADGQIDQGEWEHAESILASLDQNDDEMIGAGELVAGITYPGASGGFLLEIPQADGISLPMSLKKFPLSLLPAEPTDLVWTQRLASLPGYPKKLTSDAAVVEWRQGSPGGRWNVTVHEQGDEARLSVSGVSSSDAAAGVPCLQTKRNWITVRADQGQTTSRLETLREQTLETFQAADKDQDGRLTQAEWSEGRDGFGAAMVAMWDRDGDNVLTKDELNAWLDLQQQIGAGLVMVTAIDCGEGLLELLDADRNGALSRRELRGAAARLEEAGCGSSGQFDLKHLPRQILVTISLGLPTSTLGAIERRGPDWFLSMDRNQDGHVSEVEFVGGLEAFRSLDANGDKLITVEEVEHLAQ